MSADGGSLCSPATSERWTLRAVAWQFVAAVAATVAEYAMRVTLWAQDRTRKAKR